MLLFKKNVDKKQFQNEAALHNTFLSAPSSMVTSCGKRKPKGDKVHNAHVTIICRFVCFYYSKKSKDVFFHESQWILINSTCRWVNCVLCE